MKKLFTYVLTGKGKLMKVPKYIRDKMSRGARLHAKASEEIRKVEVWCETHGFDVDILRDGSGYSLEELDYGNDVSEVLCERMEAGFGERKNGA